LLSKINYYFLTFDENINILQVRRKTMKKLVSALIGLSLLTAPAMSDARPAHWQRGGGWVAPLVIGGIIGGVIVETTHPHPVVVEPAYPTYHTVIVSHYYDYLKGSCEVRDTYDRYNNFVTRQTVCYGE
jgi:hypothetical protein